MPAWADPDNPTPVPPAEPGRFRDFRVRLGRFASTGEDRDLRAAFRHYASKASGGPAVGARRFASMAGAGAAAAVALRTPGAVARKLAEAGVDLAALRGAPLGAVIEAVAHAFAPDNADRDKVEEALREALHEVLKDAPPDFDVAEFQGFTDDQYAALIASFLENCIVQHLTSEAGGALDRAPTPQEQKEREDQLRRTVRVGVGEHLQGLVERGIAAMSRAALVIAQTAVIEAVLRSWEAWRG